MPKFWQKSCLKYVVNPCKSFKIHRTSFPNQPKTVPNREKYVLGLLSAPNCAQVGSRRLPGLRTHALLAPFWPKMVLQGAILGPSWGPKSVKNRTFGPRSAQGPSKNDVWRRCLGPLENVSFFGWFFHGFRLHFGSLFWWCFMFCSLFFRGCFFDVF